MRLLPTRAAPGATGSVELSRAPTPFGASVTADGSPLVRPVIRAAGLPDPGELGPFNAYVAWVAPPTMAAERSIGPVANGVTENGTVDLPKFAILVTAEPTSAATERSGPIVLRALSPANRMQPPDFREFGLGAAGMPGMGADATPDTARPDAGAQAHGGHEQPDGGWRMPPMPEGIAMLPAMMALRPAVAPYLPAPASGAADAPRVVPPVRPMRVLRLADRDTLRLEAGFVRRSVAGRDLVMLAFNGQHPGPLIDVERGAEIVVLFRNRIDAPTTVHWHGLRIDNRFDGAAGVTQAPVAPGDSFTYRVRFPDPGLYWYHPHVREDVQQDLGLYGNMLVRGYDELAPVSREELLVLDDLLLDDTGPIPFGAGSPTHVFMGRFGNVALVNGEPDYALDVAAGEVVRFLITNVSNTRTWNLSMPGARLKVVGSDMGPLEREAWVESVVIAPAERYIVHARFDAPGETPLLNRVLAIDHLNGAFLPRVDTLGLIRVAERGGGAGEGRQFEGAAADPAAIAAAFDGLREHPATSADIDRYRAHFDRPVDHRLVLGIRTRDLEPVVRTLMQADSMFFPAVEWDGTMPMMNWASTSGQVEWILRDPDTGAENMDIDWRFRVGDVVKLRVQNDRYVLHGMQHPIHIHGQRFLVLSRNGIAEPNLGWKDTFLLPTGETADLLLEITNPGRWMLHCHIAEHIEAGMHAVFEVVR
jgi:suppressor of ftsI